MKQLLLILLFIPIGCIAQDFDPMLIPKKFAIKTNLLSPLALTLNASCEFSLNTGYSLQPGIAYTHFYSIDSRTKSTGYDGIQLTADFRMYVNSKVRMHGLYQQPFVRYGFIDHSYYQSDTLTNKVYPFREKKHDMSIGYTIGKQHTYNNKWLLDYFLGIYARFDVYYERDGTTRIPNSDADQSVKKNPLFSSAFGLRGGLKLGYLF